MAHSRFSPSAAKRWMACPGSIQLAESIPFVMDTTMPAAKGTLVHHMVEMLLKDRLENVSLSDYWLGRKEEIDGFVDAMAAILEEARRTPELVRTAPHTLPVKRLDDVRAARDLDLVYVG